MRVTDNTRLLSIMRQNAGAAERLTGASRRASAGARVIAPSDDPVAYTTFVRRGSSLANMTSRARTARGGADELSVAERALDSATELLAEAKSLAVQGSNETLSATDRAVLAQRVTGLRSALLELANARGAGGYVFAGSRTDTPPFASSGAFVGNDGVMRIPVSDGVAPRMNVSGAKAFTVAGGVDVFAALDTLASALAVSDVAGIRAGMDAMQSSYDQVVAVQVDAGLSIERLRSAADVIDQASLSVAQSRSRDVGADDLAGLATELSAASSSYTQSLEVTRRLLALPSLARS
jgi:flagellar hook-associated protein 3 FlgL